MLKIGLMERKAIHILSVALELQAEDEEVDSIRNICSKRVMNRIKY